MKLAAGCSVFITPLKLHIRNGVSERMKWSNALRVSASKLANNTDGERPTRTLSSRVHIKLSICTETFGSPGCSQKNLQRVSLKPYLPCVQQGLTKYPADISMVGLTNCLTKLLTPRATTKTSNMLNDKRLTLEREDYFGQDDLLKVWEQQSF